MIDLFFKIFIFLFGLFVGSFLNCIICRIEKKKSFLRGRSSCPNCNHNLSWYDLIPVLSFVFLKRKCRYCKNKISFQYPFVEILTGVVFLANYIFLTSHFFSYIETSLLFFLTILYFLIIASLLVIIFVYDLKHYIIPDKVLFPAVIISFLFNLFLGFYKNDFSFLLQGLLAGFLAALFFLLLFLVSKGEWFGFGDVKLIFFMGIFLGFPGVLVALFSAHIIGAITGIGMIMLKKKGFKSQIPFAPFLIIGTYIGLFYGKQIADWYVSLLAI